MKMLLTSLKYNATFVENLLHSLQAVFRNADFQNAKNAKGKLRSKRNRTRTCRQDSLMNPESGQVKQSTCLCFAGRFFVEVNTNRGYREAGNQISCGFLF